MPSKPGKVALRKLLEPVDSHVWTPYGVVLKHQLRELPREGAFAFRSKDTVVPRRVGRLTKPEEEMYSVFYYNTGGGRRILRKLTPSGEYDGTNPKQYYILEHLVDLESHLLDPDNATQVDSCPW